MAKAMSKNFKQNERNYTKEIYSELAGCIRNQENTDQNRHRLENHCDFTQESDKNSRCDRAKEDLIQYLKTNNNFNSHEFQRIVDFFFESCNSENRSNSNVIHEKRLDCIAKKSFVYHNKGKLPSGHRGDFIKMRNGHCNLNP